MTSRVYCATGAPGAAFTAFRRRGAGSATGAGFATGASATIATSDTLSGSISATTMVCTVSAAVASISEASEGAEEPICRSPTPAVIATASDAATASAGFSHRKRLRRLREPTVAATILSLSPSGTAISAS